MRPLRTIAAGAAVGAVALVPSSAGAATTLTIRGAGFGHGVGMSQYGALGYAKHGAGYAAILRHYYTGTALATVSSYDVRVLLADGRRSLTVAGLDRIGTQLLDPSRTYTVVPGGKGVLVKQGRRRLVTAAGPLALRAQIGGSVLLAGSRYRGSLEVRRSGSGLMAVNALRLEDYVRGVVARESPSTWPAEALKAQAVAARTYAVTTAKPGAAFDQYADVRSQVYGGVGAETTATDAAVAATRDQVVTYAGRPAVTYFFSTSGGRTENVENSFLGSDPKPWLKSVTDPYDTVSPRHRWGPFRLTAAQAQSRLRGLLRGRYKGIRVTRRGVSPRVVSATLVGTRGSTVVSGPTLRRVFGLADTWAYFTTVRTGVRKPKKAPKPTPGNGGSGGVVVDPGSVPSGGISTGGAGAAAVGLRGAVVVEGAVQPGRRGSWARLQRREGTRWVLAADVRLGGGGRYAVTAPQPGTYRVLAGRTTGPSVRVG